MVYFDEPDDPLDKPVSRDLGLVIAATGLVIVLFFVYPTPILNGAAAAAASLFGG